VQHPPVEDGCGRKGRAIRRNKREDGVVKGPYCSTQADGSSFGSNYLPLQPRTAIAGLFDRGQVSDATMQVFASLGEVDRSGLSIGEGNCLGGRG
jgi:hypothetical protein